MLSIETLPQKWMNGGALFSEKKEANFFHHPSETGVHAEERDNPNPVLECNIRCVVQAARLPAVTPAKIWSRTLGILCRSFVPFHVDENMDGRCFVGKSFNVEKTRRRKVRVVTARPTRLVLGPPLRASSWPQFSCSQPNPREGMLCIDLHHHGGQVLLWKEEGIPRKRLHDESRWQTKHHHPLLLRRSRLTQAIDYRLFHIFVSISFIINRNIL